MMPSPHAPLLLLAAIALLLLLILALCGRRLCLYLSCEANYLTEAELTAMRLLHDLLSVAEQQQLARSGYLVVPSPSVAGREYRIPARDGYVYCYESGKAIMAVCLQPAEPLPPADVVLIHKLMIEGDEQGYLRRANVRRLAASPPWAAQRRRAVGAQGQLDSQVVGYIGR